MLDMVLHAVAAKPAMASYSAAMHGWRPGAAAVPNPPAQAPPGLARPVNTVIGWGKWGVMACGVGGLLMCGAKMAIGHRNRAALAADGATGIPWVLGGLSLAAVAAALVGVFL
jgi:hypothetical protein